MSTLVGARDLIAVPKWCGRIIINPYLVAEFSERYLAWVESATTGTENDFDFVPMIFSMKPGKMLRVSITSREVSLGIDALVDPNGDFGYAVMTDFRPPGCGGVLLTPQECALLKGCAKVTKVVEAHPYATSSSKDGDHMEH